MTAVGLPTRRLDRSPLAGTIGAAVARLGPALCAAWVAAFVGFVGADVTPHAPGLRAVAIVGFGLPTVIAGVTACVRRRHPSDVWIAAALGAYAVVVALSSDHVASLETLGLVAAYASVFVVTVRMAVGRLRGYLAAAVAATVTIWAAALAVRWGGDAVSWLLTGGGFPPPTARTSVLWLSTDAVAALLILSAPYYLWIEHPIVRRALGAATFLCALLLVPLSGGRAELLGVAVGVATWLAIHVRARGMLGGRTSWAVLGGAVGLLMVGFVVLALRVDPTLSGRTHIWSTGLGLFATDPLTGSGPGTFSWARLDDAAAYAPRIPVYHAHNVVLQALADGGIVLLATMLGLCVAGARAVLPHIGRLEAGGRLAIASLAAFGTVLLLDELTQLPSLAILAAGLAGIVVGDARPTESRGAEAARWGSGRWLPAAILIAAVAALPAVASVQLARSHAESARAAAVAGNWSTALEDFVSASTLWPTNGIYHLGAALANASLGDVEAARDAYERATQLAPGDPRGWGGLAGLSDDPAERAKLLDHAARLGSGDPQYDYRLGLELWRDGRDVDAIAPFARAAVLNPQVLGVLPGGDETAARVAEHMLSAAYVGPPASAVSAGHARAVLGITDAADPLRYQALELALAGDTVGALSIAEAAVGAEPGIEEHRLAVALSDRACDRPRGQALETRLGLLNPVYGRLYAHGLVPRGPDHVYREPGLGDYQPMAGAVAMPRPNEWPGALLPDPTCEGSRP